MRSSVRKICTDRTADDGGDLLLISIAAQFLFLCRIGQEAAFDQDPRTANMLQKIDSGAFLFLPAAAGIQGGDEGRLKLPGKILGPGAEKHLSPGIPAFREIVLMDAQQQGMFRFVADPHPLFQIRCLFGGDGLPFCIDGNILPPDHPGIMAQKMQQIIQPQADLQIELTFRHPGAGYGPAVHTAVACIDDDGMISPGGQVFRHHRHSPATPMGRQHGNG